MATEVLRPQQLLGERFPLPTTSSDRRRALPANGNLAMKWKQHGKPFPKHDQSRSNAAVKSSHREVTDRRRKEENTKGGLVMGQVTLLRRGESLSSVASKIPKSSESKKIIPKKNIRLVAAPPADIYAGMAFTSSPSPRSLPQPTFFNKKDDADSFEDDATRCLRRILRLE